MIKVYFDMDGVLADWVGGVTRLLGVDRDVVDRRLGEGEKIHRACRIGSSALWRALDEAGAPFWAGLDPIPEYLDLWRELTGRAEVETRVLSSPSWDAQSLVGKVRWMQHHLGDGRRAFRDYFLSPHKHDLAAPGRLLLDDRDGLTSNFIAHGGSAILVPRPGNLAWDLGVRDLQAGADQAREWVDRQVWARANKPT